MSLGFFIEKIIDNTGERYYLYFDTIEELIYPRKGTSDIQSREFIQKIKEFSKTGMIERSQYRLPYKVFELSESEYKLLKEKKGVKEVVVNIRTEKKSSLKDLVIVYEDKEYKFEQLYKSLLSKVASSISAYLRQFGSFVSRDVVIDSFHSAIAEVAEYIEKSNIKRIEYEDLFHLIKTITGKYIIRESRSEAKFRELLDKKESKSGSVFEKKDSIDSMLIKNKLTIKYDYDEQLDIFSFDNVSYEKLKNVIKILSRIREVLKK